MKTIRTLVEVIVYGIIIANGFALYDLLNEITIFPKWIIIPISLLISVTIILFAKLLFSLSNPINIEGDNKK